jgi:single-stranded DNA-specific DHH superfamily exonuclease
MAAGMTIPRANFEIFQQAFTQVIKKVATVRAFNSSPSHRW